MELAPLYMRKLYSVSSKYPLKVVGNEKGGGSGGWLLFEDGFRPWRSMSVYFLMLPSYFLEVFPFPVCNAQLIGDCHENR
jgi:hypothetical protein